MKRFFLPLPAVTNPPARRCLSISVPDDLDHQTAFWEHFYQMTRWHSWERGPEGRGKAVADVWHSIYYDARDRWALGGCGSLLAFSNNTGFFWSPNGPGWAVRQGYLVDDCLETDENGVLVVDFEFSDRHAFNIIGPGVRHYEVHLENGVRTYAYHGLIGQASQASCSGLTEYRNAGAEEWSNYGCVTTGPVTGFRFVFNKVGLRVCNLEVWVGEAV